MQPIHQHAWSTQPLVARIVVPVRTCDPSIPLHDKHGDFPPTLRFANKLLPVTAQALMGAIFIYAPSKVKRNKA